MGKHYYGSKTPAPTPPPPPTLPPVLLASPTLTGGPQVGATVSCSTGTWANNPTGYTYQWNRNGNPITSATASTYTLSASIDVGATIDCTVTATNSAGSASALSNSVVPTAISGAPASIAAPVITGTLQKTQTVNCTTGSWTNSPTSYAYQWVRNGTAISGATSAAYTIVAADVGAVLYCTVTASNASGSASANSSSGTPIDLAPVNSVAPAISGTSTVGSTITCSTGTWTNTPTSYAYQWKRAGVNIGGATSANYTIVSLDSGQALTCTVTATNSGGSAAATSGSVTPGASPTITASPTLSGDAVVGQILYATTGTWTNSPTGYTYQWFDGSGPLVDATLDSYRIVDADAGKSIYCQVTATNSSGSATANSASTSAVANISLTNAITAFSRTSSSGVVPMTWSVTLAANVYEGYTLRAKVYSDSTLSTLVQDVPHILTGPDMVTGATIDFASDGLTAPTATQWLQLLVEATSPAGAFYSFTYPTTISPTDAVVDMVFSATDKDVGVNLTGGNLTAAWGGNGSGGFAGVRTNRSLASGKVYAEFHINSAPQPFSTQIAVLDSTESVSADWRNMDAHVAPYGPNGYVGTNSAQQGPFTTFTDNGNVDIALDVGAKKAWWRVNNGGSWFPSGDPAAGTGGLSISAMSGNIFFGVQCDFGGSVTANFGKVSYTRTPPTGFVAP